MDDSVNLILSILFGGMAVWMLWSYFRTRKEITICDRKITATRIIFLVAGVISILTVFMYNTLMDYIRIAAMCAAIAGFLLMRDGVGENGAVSMGKFTPWSMIKAYDCGYDKKKFTAIFICSDKSGKKAENYNAYIDFDRKNGEAVQKLLKEKIGNKYTRMRKN